MAIRLASSAGWWYGRQKPPGPMRMCCVWRNPSTTSRSGDGCGSHTMAWCSPIQNLLEPELVGPDDVLEVPLVAVLETALRRMTGHREYAELHAFPSPCRLSSPPGAAMTRAEGQCQRPCAPPASPLPSPLPCRPPWGSWKDCGRGRPPSTMFYHRHLQKRLTPLDLGSYRCRGGFSLS